MKVWAIRLVSMDGNLLSGTEYVWQFRCCKKETDAKNTLKTFNKLFNKKEKNNKDSILTLLHSEWLKLSFGLKLTAILSAPYLPNILSQCMRFPTMWHFDTCRLGQASAASF